MLYLSAWTPLQQISHFVVQDQGTSTTVRLKSSLLDVTTRWQNSIQFIISKLCKLWRLIRSPFQCRIWHFTSYISLGQITLLSKESPHLVPLSNVTWSPPSWYTYLPWFLLSFTRIHSFTWANLLPFILARLPHKLQDCPDMFMCKCQKCVF